jgi:hypothetical protein
MIHDDTSLRSGQLGETAQPQVPLFRFGLRQLFVFIGLISLLFGAMAIWRGSAALMMMLATAIVALHVLATAIGSRLRDRADREALGSTAAATLNERHERLATLRAAPRSPWHSRGVTILPWLTQLIIVAVVFGGVVGAAYLAITIGYRTSPAGVIVGGVSVAVVCGWIAFLFGSFYGVFRHGFREALAEQQKDVR